jgi:hypothetical protein
MSSMRLWNLNFCLAPITLAALLLLATGCATTRNIAITTDPPDATIQVDGVVKGRAPLTTQLTWESDDVVHMVQASRLGYMETDVPLRRDFDQDSLNIQLSRFHRRVVITVDPPPAMISVDGRPITTDPEISATADLEFAVDARNNWTTHTITAERFGYMPASMTVTHADKDNTYQLALQHMRKTLAVTTTVPGSNIYLDDQYCGTTTAGTPLSVVDVEFPPDPNGTDYQSRHLKATKAGYPPVQQDISWDNGNADYTLTFVPSTKIVHFVTDPSAAVVTIDGHELPRDSAGASTARLAFPPINDQGELRSYNVVISKRTADSLWVPRSFRLTWDDGQTEYPVGLKEVMTRPVSLLTPSIQHTENGWEVQPQLVQTIAMKDVNEGPQSSPPVQITRLPPGTMVDTLAMAPDGSQVLFTILSGHDRSDFKSQMVLVRTDGTGGADYLSDGKSLDLMPAFSPAGDQVVFSSDRFGNRLSVCSIAANGAPGVTQLTTDNTNALWPVLDSDPTPRLWYEALVDSRLDPRIYRTPLNSTLRTDLAPGAEPRVSPKNDAILFTQVNEKTGKRDIFRITDKGSVPENLTNSPDSDQYDPVWSKDGSRIAFVSDHGVDEDGRHNADIWVLDLQHTDQPRQITHNGSQDDCPAWDPSGNYIYFRSNRGGTWQIWRIASR